MPENIGVGYSFEVNGEITKQHETGDVLFFFVPGNWHFLNDIKTLNESEIFEIEYKLKEQERTKLSRQIVEEKGFNKHFLFSYMAETGCYFAYIKSWPALEEYNAGIYAYKKIGEFK
ncbi:MAG TPA: hypothetical protein VG895_05205 [Patescibacteria group bacterium]|nr:hypothetical protein [Patescibacteria group bacterium]